MRYHYGQTIKEYREKKHLTIAQLAELWPNEDNTGVTRGYVSDIERGVKHISDVSLLRDLAKILDIPLWKFGLSDYNPFSSEKLPETILDYDFVDMFIQQLYMIKATSGISLDGQATYISNRLSNMIRQYPSLSTDKIFMRILSQSYRLQAMKAYEDTRFYEATRLFLEMIPIAEASEDPESITLAYTGASVELMRQGKYIDAGINLQQAKDYALHSSKIVRCRVYGTMVRYYAYIGDVYNFEKFADFTANLSRGLPKGLNQSLYEYHYPSQSLEEISNGYILLDKGLKALDVLPEIDKKIAEDVNSHLSLWIPLDYAQSYLVMREIEESVKYLELFYKNALRFKWLLARVYDHLDALDSRGYGELSSVKEFREMLQDNEKH